MPDLGYGIFDCDTHCYETRDAFTRYLPKAYQARAIAPIQNAAGEEILLAGSRVATFNSEQGLGYRPRLPAGHAEGDAQADGLGQSRRDVPASAHAARVHRAGATARGCSRPRASSDASSSPPDGALAAEHYVADTDALYANLRVFQPLVRRDVGLQLPRQDLRHRPDVAPRSRSGRGPDRQGPGDGGQGRPASDRPSLRALPRRPVLRSDLGPAQRSGRDGRAAHHAVLVLRRHLAGLGTRS